MRQRLSKLAEDETAEVGLPDGWRFDGLRAVRGDATSEPISAEPEAPAAPPEVRTSMHEQLDSLTQR